LWWERGPVLFLIIIIILIIIARTIVWVRRTTSAAASIPTRPVVGVEPVSLFLILLRVVVITALEWRIWPGRVTSSAL